MAGYYLGKSKSRSVGCAVGGCRRDCLVILVAERDGKRIEVPGCEKHTAEVSQIKQQIEQGTNPKQIRIGTSKITLSELFCRVTNNPLNLDLPELKEKSESKDKIESKESKESKEWKWIRDFDKWMNARYEVIKISDMKDKELEDAVIQIKKSNIRRCTKNFRWLIELEEIASPIEFTYPEIELAVGREAAQVKLDEFYEVLLERGLLP